MRLSDASLVPAAANSGCCLLSGRQSDLSLSRAVSSAKQRTNITVGSKLSPTDISVAHRRGATLSRRAATETQEEAEVQIEGIDRNYCDEFVCTSSPQVEQNVKAMARDTTRLSTWTLGLFRKDVQYKDSFLSFSGPDNYKRLKFVKDVVGNPKVLVTKLRMLGRGKARVEWRLRGSILVFPVDADFVTDFELDLITGRIFSHTEQWNLNRLSPPAKLAFTTSRAVWSLGVRAAIAKQQSTEFVERFKKDDEENQQARPAPHTLKPGVHMQGAISQDPTDPTKFFQDQNDPTKDLFSIGAIAAFIWLVYSAYGEIAKLK